MDDIYTTTLIKVASCLKGGLRAVIPDGGTTDCEEKRTKANDSISLLDEKSLEELDDYIGFLLFKQKKRACGYYLSGKMPDDEYP